MSNAALATQLEKEEITLPDFKAIKEKQQAAWASGDYGRIGVTLQIAGEQLCEAMDIRSGQSVLDVAAGNGNVTLAAARRFCQVTSTDYVESLLDQSKARAKAENLLIDYQVADAERLPFDENSFDNVVSTYGVMFAPDQATCASELIRTCKKGGKIGLANWTPEGFIGQLFKIIGSYIAPPVGVLSPGRWGTESFIEESFRPHVENIEITKQNFCFRYESSEHWFDLFKTYYGPVHKAVLALDENGKENIKADILNLITKLNTSGDRTMVVPSEYLEIVITK